MTTKSFYSLHHRNIGVQNWEFCFLDPPRAKGRGGTITGTSNNMKEHSLAPQGPTIKDTGALKGLLFEYLGGSG